jgi:peptidyl-prolyl cis-trans isomerase A (cyclophilin A)
VFLVASALQAQEPAPAPASAPTSAEVRAVAAAPPTVTVRMQTALGAIVFAIESARAPLTAANFLRYVDQKRFDHSVFYRAMKVGDTGEAGLVQGGLRGDPHRALKPIAHEPTSVTDLSHVSGAISMARAAPGTASSDFFIVVGDLLALDAHEADAATGQAADPGYAVFGHVVDGMDVVRAILAQPVSNTAPAAVMKGQMIAQPVAIVSVRRVAAACGGSPCSPRE